MHPLGVIHGRFQGLHNDHLKYLLAAQKRCDFLYVGITNPDAGCSLLEPTAKGRETTVSNPFTYWEREAMIRASLMEAGVVPAAFTIVPFPISIPEKLSNFAPSQAVYFMTIYDDWGREKKKRLETLGLTVEVMWERDASRKGITATLVRQCIMEGKPLRDLVPPAVERLIGEFEAAGRLRRLANREDLPG